MLDIGLWIMLWSLFQGFPACPVEGIVSSPYGKRIDPISHRRRWHQGLDVAADKGTPIHSMFEGKVVASRRSRGYGRWVYVRTNRILVRYAHMDEVYVERGQRVFRGEVIGAVGDTGRATGPHLHLEVWDHGETKDPWRYAHLCFYERL